MISLDSSSALPGAADGAAFGGAGGRGGARRAAGFGGSRGRGRRRILSTRARDCDARGWGREKVLASVSLIGLVCCTVINAAP